MTLSSLQTLDTYSLPKNECGCKDCNTIIRGDDKKKDHGKLMWDLLPLESTEDIVKILTFGATKYGAHSWRTVEDAKNRYFAALMRHLVAYRNGELIDAESGLPHLAHAGCNILFLAELEKEKDAR